MPYPADDRILIEFVPAGRMVKVSAIDPVTMTEVCIVGDATASQEHLSRLATRKLRYVMEKKKKKS